MQWCTAWGNDIPWDTVLQLQYAHNIFTGGQGSINFSDLFSSPFWGMWPPYAQFVFRDPDCQGYMPFVYNYLDVGLVYENKIKDGPKITKPSCWIEFAASTITTTDGVSIKWNQTLFPTVAPEGAVSVDVWAFGLTDSYGFFASRTKSEDNEIAVRKIGNKVVPVENTLEKGVSIGKYSLKASKRDVPFSDILARGVCMGGQVRKNYRWFPPEIVELVKK